MDMTALLALLSVVGTLSGIYLGWSAKGREQAKEHRSEGSTSARLQADVEYIKRGIDDIRVDVRAQGQRLDQLTERVAKVEGRLDALERRAHGAD